MILRATGKRNVVSRTAANLARRRCESSKGAQAGVGRPKHAEHPRSSARELDAAVPMLERALSIHEGASAPPRERALVRLALARARHHEGNVARARALARAAATEAEEAGVLAADLLAQAEGLLEALE